MSAERVIYFFSADQVPAAEVDSGAILVVETRDAYDRRFQRDRDIQAYLSERANLRMNPATGPIFVRGLAPGDGLDVTIERIDLGAVGYVAAVPEIGVLGGMDIVPQVAAFEVRPDGLWYEGGLQLPLRPNVGTIGVAPGAGAVATMELGDHGGNLDCNDIAAGTTVHLPVQAAGGLLAVGDVHASMGFGEVYSGVNIDATVTMTVTRVPAAGWERPWFETEAAIMALGVGARVEDAIRIATLDMTRCLQRRLGISFTEAVVLTGAACDIRLGQASKFGVNVSAYAVFPKNL